MKKSYFFLLLLSITTIEVQSQNYYLMPIPKDSVSIVKEQAEQGNAIAQIRMAYHYGYYGKDRVARHWLEKAATNGDTLAMYEMGYGYATGRMIFQDIKRNPKKAIQWYEKAGRLGMVGKARMYEYGNGVPQNIEEAYRLYHNAKDTANEHRLKELLNYYAWKTELIPYAENNDRLAQYSLGVVYAEMHDTANAMEWLLKSVGAETEYDKREKMKILVTIDQYGYSDALLNLSKMMRPIHLSPNQFPNNLDFLQYIVELKELSKFYTTNYDEAISHGYLLRDKMSTDWGCPSLMGAAANCGNKEALFHMGRIYNFGEEKDYEKAAFYYLLSHMQGYSKATRAVKKLQIDGLYTLDTNKFNDRVAFDWYLQQAEEGYADAQAFLGNLYYNGTGTKEDHKRAAYWWRKSADGPTIHGKYLCGWSCENGIGRPKDIDSARYWYTLLADVYHYEHAKDALKRLDTTIVSKPQIVWHNCKIENGVLVIDATVKSELPISYCKVFINGKEYQEVGIGSKKGSSIIDDTEGYDEFIPIQRRFFNIRTEALEGSNSIKITAINGNGESSQHDTVVVYISERKKQTSSSKYKKIAILLANDKYDNLAPLNNPKNDAVAISEKLNEIGFEKIILRNNLTKYETDKLLDSIEKTVVSGHYDVALFYYSGHGVNADDGYDYLLATDSKQGHDEQTRKTSIPLNKVIQIISKCKTQGVVLIDACRVKSENNGNEPRMDEKGRVVLLLGTDYGNWADDGVAGSHSPFANAILQNITRDEIFSDVISQVIGGTKTRTNNRQKAVQKGTPLPGFKLTN